MPARKGHVKAGGRKRGTPNKATAAVKAALVEAFDQLGGVSALVKWGKKHPTQFYALWIKLLPQEVKNAGGEPLKVHAVTEVVVRTRAEAAAFLALEEAHARGG